MGNLNTSTTFVTYSANASCSGTAFMYYSPVSIPRIAGASAIVGSIVYYVTSPLFMTINSQLNHDPSFTDQAACNAAFPSETTTFISPTSCCFSQSVANQAVGIPQTLDVSGFVQPFHIDLQ